MVIQTQLSSCRFNTIGLTKFDNDFRSLVVSLIPPAVFIAVLAMQLRYFTPKSPLASRLEEEAIAVDLVSLFPKFVRNAVQSLRDEGDEEEGNDDKRTEHCTLYPFTLKFCFCPI